MKNLRRICFLERYRPAKAGEQPLPGEPGCYGIAYWLEFEDDCLCVDDETMKLHRCCCVPAEAKPIPLSEDEMVTGALPRSFLGSSLVSLEHDEPYLMRFSHGGILNLVFDYRTFTNGPEHAYLSPTFFSPTWLAAPENAEANEELEEPAAAHHLIDLASIPAARFRRAQQPLPETSPHCGTAFSLVLLYAPLGLFSFALFPLIAGLWDWVYVPAVLLWLVALLLHRLRGWRRWGAYFGLSFGLAVLIYACYRWWRERISSPTWHSEGWYWYGLDFPAPTHLQLWLLAVVPLALALLLPQPRWRWWGDVKGSLPLLPWVAVGILLAWGMSAVLLKLYLGWLLPLLEPLGEH